MNIKRIAAAAAGLLVMAAGCGTPDDVRETQPDHGPDISRVAGAIPEYFLVPMASSPEELIENGNVKVVVAGAVEAINLGRNIHNGPKPPQSETEPAAQHFLVLQVHVSDTMQAGDPGEVHNERVYVELPQGPLVGDDSRCCAYSLEDWREAIPVGTRVMLFLSDFDQAKENGAATEHEGRGLPDGARLLSPDPQGISFEYDGKLIGFGQDAHYAWGDAKSIDDITSRVTQHLNNT